MEKTEVKLNKALTPRSIALMLALSIIAPILGEFMYRFTTKPNSFGGIFLFNYFIFILLNELVGIINRKWKLSPSELLFLFPSIAWASGKYMLIQGTPTPQESIMRNLDGALAHFAIALTTDATKSYYLANAPPFMFPSQDRERIAQMLVNGISPGEVLPWGTLIGPMTYWILLQLLFVFFNISLVFVINRPWVEVERLTYSYGIGSIYLTELISQPTTNGRFRFLTREGLKDPRIKAFWISFFTIGSILNLIPLLGEFIPALAFGAEWGHRWVWLPMPKGILPPGGMWVTALILPFLIIPMDILYTHLLMWFLIGVVYTQIGLYTGAIAWQDWWDTSPWGWFSLGTMDPFPYRIFANTGCMLGIAAWSIWNLRDRLKTLFGTLKGGEDVDEYGLSGRFLMIWGIASFLALLVLGSASGVPVIVMFLWLLLYMCWRITGSRIWAEATTMDSHLYGQHLHLGLIYPVGVGLGYWQHPPPAEGNPPSMLAWNAIANIASGGAGARQSFWGGDGLTLFYKMIHTAKANFKHIFIGLIVSVIIATTVGYVTDIWIFAHAGGISRVNTTGTSAGILTMGVNVLSPDTVKARTWPTIGIWGTLGFITVIALYLLRMRFAWFFINPVGVLVGTWCAPYAWLNSLIVVVIRLLALRIFGARRYEQYAVPVVAGSFAAIMLWYVPFAIWHFFDTAWPRFLSQYTP